MSGNLRLVADIGGTNARFALVAPGQRPGPPERVSVSEHPDIAAALAQVLAGRRVGSAAIAAAGPVHAGRVHLTNAAWEISEDAVSAALGGVPVRLVNDLEAVALALPHLDPGDLSVLRGGATEARAPRLAVNVGTGFGASLAVPTPAGWVAVATEPGHMRFTAASEAEHALSAFVATFEDVLSGRGIAALHARLSGYLKPVEPARVIANAAQAEPAAVATVELATGLLARVAADLTLATGAWGGIALCGSVVEALSGVEAAGLGPAFDAAFERPNPVAGRLSAVPVARILHPHPALLGLALVPDV